MIFVNDIEINYGETPVLLHIFALAAKSLLAGNEPAMLTTS